MGRGRLLIRPPEFSANAYEPQLGLFSLQMWEHFRHTSWWKESRTFAIVQHRLCMCDSGIYFKVILIKCWNQSLHCIVGFFRSLYVLIFLKYFCGVRIFHPLYTFIWYPISFCFIPTVCSSLYVQHICDIVMDVWLLPSAALVVLRVTQVPTLKQ